MSNPAGSPHLKRALLAAGLLLLLAALVALLKKKEVKLNKPLKKYNKYKSI